MIDAAVSGVIGLLATETILPTFSIDIDQLDGYLRVAGEIIAVVFFVAWVRKRADAKTEKRTTRGRSEMEARLIEKLEQRTQPIQPQYRNDGESLADIANEVKRQGGVIAESQTLLLTVNEKLTTAVHELALHRIAVQEQFAKIRDEREAILTAADERAQTWRVALEKQGLAVPPEPDNLGEVPHA